MDVALLVALALLSLTFLTHDLVPLGRWNNLVDNTIPLPKRFVSTLMNSLPGLIPTWLAWRSLGVYGRTSVRVAITIFLCALVVGELLSWWMPWVTGASIVDRKNLAAMTSGTYSFLPTRNGITVNALHCVIHAITLVALALSVRCMWP